MPSGKPKRPKQIGDNPVISIINVVVIVNVAIVVNVIDVVIVTGIRRTQPPITEQCFSADLSYNNRLWGDITIVLQLNF